MHLFTLRGANTARREEKRSRGALNKHHYEALTTMRQSGDSHRWIRSKTSSLTLLRAPYSGRFSCGNWARGCPGGPTAFGPELTPNLTPGSSAFFLGQRVGALNRDKKQLRAATRDARRAAQPAQSRRGSGRAAAGSLGGRFSAPGAASAPPRRIGWGKVDYEPGGRLPRGPPADKDRAGRRPAPALAN